MKDYYEILGVGPDSTLKEITRAFRKLAFAHHPDHGGDAEQFRKVRTAYEVLSDESKRAEYDRLGHNEYEETDKSQSQRGQGVPSWKDIEEMISTDTPADRYFGYQGYPSAYVGGIVEDLYTGDTYGSAQDIRIAKMERAVFIHLPKIMEAISDKDKVLDISPERLVQMITDFRDAKWMSDEEYGEHADKIAQYIRELPERKRRETERQRKERMQVRFDPVQEKMEVTGEKERLRKISAGRSGDKVQKDPDVRKRWRRRMGDLKKRRH